MDADAVEVNPEILTLPDRRILYVVGRTADYGTFGNACRGAIGALFKYLGENSIVWQPGSFGGLTPHGALPSNMIKEASPDGEEAPDPEYYKAFVMVDLELDVPPSDIVEDGVLPGGRELVGTHVGPYRGLFDSWPMLERHRNEIGERVRDDVIYDLYVDDPANVAESDLRTEMHIPLE